MRWEFLGELEVKVQLKCACSEGGVLLREPKWIRRGLENGKRYMMILRLALFVEEQWQQVNGYRLIGVWVEAVDCGCFGGIQFGRE